MLVVIDVNENYEKIIEMGIYDFLLMHLKELNIYQNSNDNSEDWIVKKDIIISFNKKDLINNQKLKILNEKLNNFKQNLKTNIQINKISCAKNDISLNDLNELSDHLKIKLENL